jgi:hypothetical protein
MDFLIFPFSRFPLYVAGLFSKQIEELNQFLNLLHIVLQILHHQFHSNGDQKSTALFKYVL